MEESGRFCLVVDDCLPRRGPIAFDRFCVILACNDNPRVAAKLKIGEGKIGLKWGKFPSLYHFNTVESVKFARVSFCEFPFFAIFARG